MRLRKPVDRLPSIEQTRLVSAFAALMASPDPATNYSFWASIHAHCCPHRNALFLPWHRAYIHEFESALQRAVDDPELTLPYWDWVRLPDIPALLNQPPLEVEHYSDEFRRLHNRRLPTAGEVDPVMQLPHFFQFGGNSCASGPGRLEDRHGLVHTWAGPLMNAAATAAFDPLFWLHHANVDRLWLKWQRDHPGDDPSCRKTALKGIPGDWNVEDVLDVLSPRLTYDYVDEVIVLQRESHPVRQGSPLIFTVPIGRRNATLQIQGIRRASGKEAPASLDVIVDNHPPIPVSLFGLAPPTAVPGIVVVPIPACPQAHAGHDHDHGAAGIDATINLSWDLAALDGTLTFRIAMPTSPGGDDQAAVTIADVSLEVSSP